MWLQFLPHVPVMSFRCMVGSPYPNVDGTCVNQESPDLGAIGAKFLRLQPAAAGKDGKRWASLLTGCEMY